MSEAQNTTKMCPKCVRGWQELAAFCRDRCSPDGRQRVCRSCESGYRRTNRARIRERGAAYYQANKGTMDAQSAAWYQANKDSETMKAAGRYQAGKAGIKERRVTWRANNRAERLAYQRKYTAEHRDRYKARTAVFKAIKSGDLTREPCKTCDLKPKAVNGRNRIEAHHHKGYDEEFWLDVEWYCALHHGQADAALRRAEAAIMADGAGA